MGSFNVSTLRNLRMRFGKYRNWKLENIPPDYVSTLLQAPWVNTWLHDRLVAWATHIAYRRVDVKMPFGKHRGKRVSELGSRYIEHMVQEHLCNGELLASVLEDEYASRHYLAGDGKTWHLHGVDDVDEKGDTRPFDPSACRTTKHRRPPVQVQCEEEDSLYHDGLPAKHRLQERADAHRVTHARVQTGVKFVSKKRRKGTCVITDTVEVPKYESVVRRDDADRVAQWGAFLRGLDWLAEAPDFLCLRDRARVMFAKCDMLAGAERMNGGKYAVAWHLVADAVAARRLTLLHADDTPPKGERICRFKATLRSVALANEALASMDADIARRARHLS